MASQAPIASVSSIWEAAIDTGSAAMNSSTTTSAARSRLVWPAVTGVFLAVTGWTVCEADPAAENGAATMRQCDGNRRPPATSGLGCCYVHIAHYRRGSPSHGRPL